jgi:hypothetical protein
VQFLSSSWDCMLYHEEIPKMHKIPWGTSKCAKNPMRIFQKCTKSHDWLRIMHKILWLTAKNCAYLKVPHGIVYILAVHHGILCIIRSQSWDFVHF